MRESETCPKCRSRKLFVIEEVRNEDPEYAKLVPTPVAVGEQFIEGGLLGGFTKILKAGTFEAWVCAKCGFTEWYAGKLAAIARLAETARGVRVVEHEESGDAPYRG